MVWMFKSLLNLLLIMIFITVIIMIVLNIIRARYSYLLKKEAEKVLADANKNYQFWIKKLEEEQKNLQSAMDIIDKEYYEYIKQRKKQPESSTPNSKQKISKPTPPKQQNPENQ